MSLRKQIVITALESGARARDVHICGLARRVHKSSLTTDVIVGWVTLAQALQIDCTEFPHKFKAKTQNCSGQNHTMTFDQLTKFLSACIKLVNVFFAAALFVFEKKSYLCHLQAVVVETQQSVNLCWDKKGTTWTGGGFLLAKKRPTWTGSPPEESFFYGFSCGSASCTQKQTHLLLNTFCHLFAKEKKTNKHYIFCTMISVYFSSNFGSND